MNPLKNAIDVKRARVLFALPYKPHTPVELEAMLGYPFGESVNKHFYPAIQMIFHQSTEVGEMVAPVLLYHGFPFGMQSVELGWKLAVSGILPPVIEDPVDGVPALNLYCDDAAKARFTARRSWARLAPELIRQAATKMYGCQKAQLWVFQRDPDSYYSKPEPTEKLCLNGTPFRETLYLQLLQWKGPHEP